MQTASTRRRFQDAGDATDLLRAQHREIDELLAALVRAPHVGEKARVLAEVGDLVAVHLALEERVFYPGLQGDGRDDESRSVAMLAVQDHVDAKRRLAELLELGVEDASFDAAAEVLRDGLRSHAAAEERRLFPRIRQRVPYLRLRRLAYEMRVLEFQLRTEAAPRHLVIADASPANA
jgi:iron-sulfur cluster repair protein YtfE (RIC family)